NMKTVQIVAVILRTFGNTELRKFLEKDERLRQAIGFERVPDRTCIGRRLSGLVPEAGQQIALLGRQIVDEVRPEDEQHEVSAIDGRMYKAQGPKWHKSDRQKDVMPWTCSTPTSNPNCPRAVIADGSKATLVAQGLGFPEPVPIFAAWHPNNEN